MAIAASPLYPGSEAEEVVVPGGGEECKVVAVPANVDIGAFVKKRIQLLGVILNIDVDQNVLVVEKTVAVRVCVRTEGDVLVQADLEPGVNGDVNCPNGAAGVAIRPTLDMAAGGEGGAVIVTVEVAVTDEDEVLGIAFDKLEVVIEEEKRLEVGPLVAVEDQDGANADVCVGPVTAH